MAYIYCYRIIHKVNSNAVWIFWIRHVNNAIKIHREQAFSALRPIGIWAFVFSFNWYMCELLWHSSGWEIWLVITIFDDDASIHWCQKPCFPMCTINLYLSIGKIMSKTQSCYIKGNSYGNCPFSCTSIRNLSSALEFRYMKKRAQNVITKIAKDY